MYYYAFIDSETRICYDIYESETQITDDPYCIEIDSYDRSYIIRKKYVDGVWVDTQTNEVSVVETRHISLGDVWLDDKIYEMENDISNHTHSGYASSDDLALLGDVIDTKANVNHTHSEYAPLPHSHSEYATAIALDSLESIIDSKANANHSHTEYAVVDHSHNTYAEINHSHSNYSETTHGHDNYALTTHTHTASEVGAATSAHNHDGDYADINHAHNNYATTASLNELSSTVSGKANASHSHNDVYYTETEIDAKLADKADSSHTHTGVYDVNGAAANALTSAKTYTDSKIDALVGDGASATLDTIGEISSAIEDNQDAIDLLNSAIANKANVLDLNYHASDMELHITETERIAWNAKSNFSGSYNDLTDKPSIPSISGLATEAYVDEAVSTKADNGHTHGDIYYTESEVDSLLSGKANATHSHAIADVTGLQNALDGKAASSHGTHVSYSTTVPVMDGTASVGTASTVARSDHKHPVDTSRASKTEFDTHVADAVKHITSTERTNWGVAYTHSQTSHAPSNAEKNQNAFSNITVGSTTVSADTATDTLTLVAGSNVTITPDATNDKITISATNTTYSVATTSVAGLMSATDKAKLDGIASSANAYTHPSYTARTGVPTANATLSHGGTFTVTQPVCDATGHITALNTRTYTLPSDNNTDTKVTNTLATTTKAYVTGTTSATTNTGTQVFDTGVYLDTTAGKLVATTFGGSTFSGSGVATVSETKTYLGI